MRRASGYLLVLVVAGLLVWWLGWLPVVIGLVVIGTAIGVTVLVLARKGFYLMKSGPPRRHPGKRIGVRAPETGVVMRIRTEDLPAVIDAVETAEQGDPAARQVVETIAFLRADGVSRTILRPPDDEEHRGFAPDADTVLDRLCTAGLLTEAGDTVAMDPTQALAVRLRAEDNDQLRDLIAAAVDVMYAHALDVRLRANRIAFDRADPAGAGAVVERAREVLDQAVSVAWYSQYTYDKSLDTILQCNAALAEAGELDDAYVLAKQMAALCRERLGAANPVSYEASESLPAVKKMRAERRA